MFQGAIPPTLQSITAEYVKDWNCQDVFVGCSGNFTIERCLAHFPRNLHGCDVNIYTCALGRFFSGQNPGLWIKPEAREEMQWLEHYLRDPASSAATIMLATRLLEGYGKSASPYYERMRKAWKAQWPALHEKTKRKLEAVGLRLASFQAADAADVIQKIPQDWGVATYPPFTGNSGGDGYAKMFETLDKVFAWDNPSYRIMDDEQTQRYIKAVTNRENWLLGVPDKIPALEKHLKGMSVTTNRGVPIYVYASKGKTRVVQPNQKTTALLMPRLAPGMKIGEKLSLVKLSGAQFSTLRSEYLNAHIKPGSAQMPIGVLVDGYLVGVFALQLPNGVLGEDGTLPTPTVYLMTDFAVAPTDYKRLSKLVLYAILSNETKLLAEGLTNKRVRAVTTTAFSNNEVSMKYRGMLNLLSKKENAPGEYHKYKLNYGAVMGQWSLDEGFKQWKEKHGQTQLRRNGQ